jgi:hypothetical protein
MILGRFKIINILIMLILTTSNLYSTDKVISVPLVNLEKLKPSFEEVESENINEKNTSVVKLKEKKTQTEKSKNKSINIIGLDKITAKTSAINIKIGETKKFGLLEIKAIKCGKTNSNNKKNEAAYIQVKDISDSENEKVFVFNGWTFSSNPSLRPIDHPVYDLWLVGCENI